MVAKVVFDEPGLLGNGQEPEDRDLQYLLSYLQRSRSQSYQILERPDTITRNSVAPDFLVMEKPSGRRLAVEHTQLVSSDLQAAKARLLRAGAVIVPGTTVEREAIASHLDEALDKKVKKGQLLAIEADERILLVHNHLIAPALSFLRASLNFPDRRVASVDHAYLIASRMLIELW